MQSTPIMEAIMKSSATHLLVRFATVVAVAAPLAASGGKFYSDERLKDEIATVDDPIGKLRRIGTA